MKEIHFNGNLTLSLIQNYVILLEETYYMITIRETIFNHTVHVICFYKKKGKTYLKHNTVYMYILMHS